MKKGLFFLMTMVAVPVMAQLDNTVEVTNEVKPVATEAKKVDVKSKAAETKVKPVVLQYAVQEQPIGQYAEEPLGDYRTEAMKKGNKKGYLHLGGGSHSNVDGQASYQLDLTDRDLLDLDFTLKGFNGRVKDTGLEDVTDWKSRDYHNSTRLNYRHKFDNGVDYFLKGGFENRMFNYMSNLGNHDKQHNVMGDVSLGFTPFQTGAFSFSAKAGIDYFKQRGVTALEKGLRETLIHADAEAAYQIADGQRVETGAQFYHSDFGNKELKGINRLRLTPHYLYTTEQMNLKLGLFVSTYGNVAPDVELTYHLTPESDVFVQAVGYEQDNTFRRLSGLHPYFAVLPLNLLDDFPSLTMEAEFHQFDVCVGYQFKSDMGLTGKLKAGLDFSKNYAPDSDILVDFKSGNYCAWMDFAKSRRFYLNADFAYAYKDLLKVEAKNQMNFESCKVLDEWIAGTYFTPLFEMDWKVDAKLMDDLYVGLDWTFATYKKPNWGEEIEGQYERPNTVCLGASIRYTLPFEYPLTLFVKGNNLLNRNYDRYFAYRNIGANFLAGFALSF